jgi:hypothetical protein
VLENRVLRKTFGLKREELTGCRVILHNVELENMYSSSNSIRANAPKRM